MNLTLISGLLDLLNKFGQYELTKKLREHSDALLAIEQKLNAADAAFINNTDDRDDVAYVTLLQQKVDINSAFQRDIQLALNQPATATTP